MFINAVVAFLIYFLAGGLAMVLFTALYLRITEHDEIALIRGGNLAAAIALCGSMAGFAIPLARTITQSTGLLEMAAWALVALVVQILVYLLARFVFRDISTRIANGEMSGAVFLATVSIIAGLINSASMTL